jgi:Dynein heavy chain AAA lid domain
VENHSPDVKQVVYGAHMTDGYDSRVIVTYLQEFCGAFIFNSKFYFYQDNNTSYGLPSIQNLFGILGIDLKNVFPPNFLTHTKPAAYIQNLPLNYSPGVLGLHSNADVEHNKRCLVELVANLMKLQPQPG